MYHRGEGEGSSPPQGERSYSDSAQNLGESADGDAAHTPHHEAKDEQRDERTSGELSRTRAPQPQVQQRHGEPTQQVTVPTTQHTQHDASHSNQQDSHLVPSERYEVLEVLYPTLFGVVLVAQDVLTGSQVVIKRSSWRRLSERKLSATSSSTGPGAHEPRAQVEALQDRAHSGIEDDPLSESAVLRALPPHPHVLSLLREHRDDEYHYIVTERATADLLQALHSTPEGHFAPSQAQRYFSQVARGLQHLHEHSVCHMDLSLENVVLDTEGDCRIIDFGLARELPAGGGCFGSVAGEVKPGKRVSTAPEVWNHEPFDGRRADCWSLGILLHVMLVGNYPFESPSEQDEAFRRIYADGVQQVPLATC